MFYDKASNFNEVFSEIDYFKKLGDDIINLRLNEI
jgi:hypothetical protein